MAEPATDLRTELAQAFSRTATANGRRLGPLRFDLADAALAVFDDDAQAKLVADMMARTRIRSLDFRNGMDLDIDAAPEITAMYVAYARTMLGDAPNYSETKVEFTVKVAESPEEYVLIVQRAGKPTPHQARKRAEAERDAALAEVDRLRAQLEARDV